MLALPWTACTNHITDVSRAHRMYIDVAIVQIHILVNRSGERDRREGGGRTLSAVSVSWVRDSG